MARRFGLQSRCKHPQAFKRDLRRIVDEDEPKEAKEVGKPSALARHSQRASACKVFADMTRGKGGNAKDGFGKLYRP